MNEIDEVTARYAQATAEVYGIFDRDGQGGVTCEEYFRIRDSLVDILRLLQALDILAGICADATRIDPDDFHSSPGKSRQECWAEWAIKKVMEEAKE